MNRRVKVTENTLPAVVGVDGLLDGVFKNIPEIVDVDLQVVLTVSASSLLLVANDIGLQREFLRRYNAQSHENQEVFEDIYHRLLVALQGAISKDDHYVQTIDTYGQRVSASAAVGGVGALLWGAAAAGSIPILGPLVLTMPQWEACSVSLCVFGEGIR
jgi:hypothetical protein